MTELKKDKKFIAARGDLLQKVIEISNRRGKTVYGFVNEIFEQAIKAEELESTLPDILEFYKLIDTMRKGGAVITTHDILDYSVKRLYELEKDTLLERWHISGLWYGKYLAAKYNDPIEVFQNVLTACFWDVSEVNFTDTGGGVLTLRIVAPNHSLENTEMLLKFIEGVMNALDYKTVNKEFWKGIIILKLQKRVKLPDIDSTLESM